MSSVVVWHKFHRQFRHQIQLPDNHFGQFQAIRPMGLLSPAPHLSLYFVTILIEGVTALLGSISPGDAMSSLFPGPYQGMHTLGITVSYHFDMHRTKFQVLAHGLPTLLLFPFVQPAHMEHWGQSLMTKQAIYALLQTTLELSSRMPCGINLILLEMQKTTISEMCISKCEMWISTNGLPTLLLLPFVQPAHMEHWGQSFMTKQAVYALLQTTLELSSRMPCGINLILLEMQKTSISEMCR